MKNLGYYNGKWDEIENMSTQYLLLAEKSLLICLKHYI